MNKNVFFEKNTVFFVHLFPIPLNLSIILSEASSFKTLPTHQALNYLTSLGTICF